MPESPYTGPQDPSGQKLAARLSAVGHALGEREAPHHESLDAARRHIEALRSHVEIALEAFHQASSRAGAPHLRVELGDVRIDDKHLRSVEFELLRGRQKAVVTAKSHGDVTLVGPFRVGKAEKPCLTFPADAGCKFDEAFIKFLEKFLEGAATP